MTSVTFINGPKAAFSLFILQSHTLIYIIHTCCDGFSIFLPVVAHLPYYGNYYRLTYS